MSSEGKSFARKLAGVRLRRQLGLFAADCLRLAGWAIVALAVYALADRLLAPDASARKAANVAILAGLAFLFILRCARTLRFTDRDAATMADAVVSSRRRAILSAHELLLSAGRETADESALPAFLTRRTVDSASTELDRMSFGQRFPVREIRKQAAILAVIAISAAAAGRLAPSSTATLLGRIFFPGRDIPPCTRYEFAISPWRPVIPYNGDAEISVEISGAPVRSQVRFLTRHGGAIREAVCFQETPTRFAQRLEKVVSPVEFCFAAGRARSKWHGITLRMQPKIAMAAVEITPPAYSGLPKREFYVGNEDMAALKRSKARLTVGSNRPLLDGTMRVKAADVQGEEHTVTGTRTGPKTVAFEWSMERPADLDITIRDLLGTPNRERFVVRQTITPDKPPKAAIVEPPPFALATPGVKLEIKTYAEDDLGIGRVELVRTVAGYRDYLKQLGPDSPVTRFQAARTLDLAHIGAAPGETLEFYLEARDLNPDAVGAAVSDISRVRIISEADYAALIRSRTTIEQFVTRFQAVHYKARALKKALTELEEAARAEDPKAAGVVEKAKLARQATESAADFFRQAAADFPAFDMENALADKVNRMADQCEENVRRMDDTDPETPGYDAFVRSMLDALGMREEKIAEDAAGAEETAQVARLIECAARFRLLSMRQEQLARRLARFEKETRPADAPILPAMGAEQRAVREELARLRDDIVSRAGELPEQYFALTSSALEFARAIGGTEADTKRGDEQRDYRIPELMRKAEDASARMDGPDTRRHSVLALEAMQQLTEDSAGDFGKICRNPESDFEFKVPKDLHATLRQLVDAMLQQLGGGGADGDGYGGFGGGGAIGGDKNDGYWSGGHSLLGIPVIGPPRTAYAAAGGAGAAAAMSRPGGGALRIALGATETLGGGVKDGAGGESSQMEIVPEKYLEAVKKYFSEAQEKE